MLEETCMNRFLGICKGCAEDYDQAHHPNNYDCPRFYQTRIFVHEVIEDSYAFKKEDIK